MIERFDTSGFQRIVFFTGAGTSAESGVPTYRGRGGIWASYDYETIACQEAFEKDPEKVWDFHDWRRDMMAKAEPNLAHRIIAALQRDRPDSVVITQNIDGLHQRAGATDVLELHGSVWRVRCDMEGKIREDFTQPLPSRRCECGEYLRPDIVWFGDPLKRDVVRRAAEAIGDCDLLISIGTSGVVYPAADFPRIARQMGRTCIEINPEETPLSEMFDLVIRGTASDGLAHLFPQYMDV
jgi:NAD-dependent deacetylase